MKGCPEADNKCEAAGRKDIDCTTPRGFQDKSTDICVLDGNSDCKLE
jgi:hypothetical protein